MGLLDLGLGGDTEVAPEDLGSGGLKQAAQQLSGRDLQLKQQECNVYGMIYDELAGKCVRLESSEPALDE